MMMIEVELSSISSEINARSRDGIVKGFSPQIVNRLVSLWDGFAVMQSLNS
jgi:hypothetical protein